MPADPRMQDARELPRRVVRHDQPHLVPTRLERGGLELRVLDDRSPERPRERHHDADLHSGRVCVWSVSPLSVRSMRAIEHGVPDEGELVELPGLEA